MTKTFIPRFPAISQLSVRRNFFTLFEEGYMDYAAKHVRSRAWVGEALTARIPPSLKAVGTGPSSEQAVRTKNASAARFVLWLGFIFSSVGSFRRWTSAPGGATGQAAFSGFFSSVSSPSRLTSREPGSMVKSTRRPDVIPPSFPASVGAICTV